MRWIWLALLEAACFCSNAAAGADWTLVRSKHFEIYSQSDAQTARTALLWFEQLRMFFEQSGFLSHGYPPVKVVGFRSTKDYQAFRLRPGASAYYLGIGARDYIVMPSLGSAEFITAAHEYTHLELRVNGLKLPLWLNEGLADFFSSVRITQHECYLGGDLAARVATLRQHSWIPIGELLAATSHSAIQVDQRTAPLFYAQSWALTQMLALSPDYGPRFHDVVANCSSGVPSTGTLTRIYRKSLNEITRDLVTWVDARKSKAVRLPGIPNPDATIETHTLSQLESSLLLADLVMADGQLDRAEVLYRQLAQVSPRNPEIWAELGSIALRKGDAKLARHNWKCAIDNGVKDAQLYYRYAQLAEDAGLGADEIRPALRQAVALEPEFDDARYKLALLESNAGRFDEALAQLQAMRNVAAARGFGYWCAMAYASEELGRRDDAQRAADKALQYATTADEREHARQLAYLAATDFAVQFARDANGQPQLVTARVPHNSTNWNPFIEPGDHIRRVEGQLRAITCTAGKATAVMIESRQGTLQLAIADSSKVEVRNAPTEFVCGLQTGKSVAAEYAASSDVRDRNAGVLRGLQFR